MPDFAPQSPATFAQPGVEFLEAAPFTALCIDPNTAATVLHILLDHTLLPAAGDVAEISVKQVVRAHDGKAGVDGPALTFFDLVHRRLHVVVDASARNAAQGRKGARMSIKQHLMALAGIGHQPEGPAGAQLHVGDLHAVVDATDHHAFLAPVKLKGFAQVELQGHKRFDVFARAGAPGTDEVGDTGVATSISTGLDLHKQCTCAASILFGAQRVGFEGLLQLDNISAELAKPARAVIGRRLHSFWCSQPAPYRVARQSCSLGYFMQRQFVAQMHASNSS